MLVTDSIGVGNLIRARDVATVSVSHCSESGHSDRSLSVPVLDDTGERESPWAGSRFHRGMQLAYTRPFGRLVLVRSESDPHGG
jgi:hypothetical protein